MHYEPKIYDHLLEIADLVALVGNRIFSVEAPQTARRPYVVFNTVSDIPDQSNDGPDGDSYARVQFSSVADTLLACRQVDEAIRVGLDHWSGDEVVHGVIHDSGPVEVPVPPIGGKQFSVRMCVSEYLVIYSRPLPAAIL